jgi:anti-sigma B factor antagonist
MTDGRPEFHVEIVQRSDTVVVVAAAGEIDLYTAPQLHESLSAVIAEGAQRVVLDLSAVSFLDSTALGVLVTAIKALQPAGSELHLVCPDEKLRRIIEITGLDSVMIIHRSLDEALAVRLR